MKKYIANVPLATEIVDRMISKSENTADDLTDAKTRIERAVDKELISKQDADVLIDKLNKAIKERSNV